MKENRLEELKKEGWDKMYLILEKELPQRKKDKRFPIFWFLLGSGISILGFYLFSILNKVENPLPTQKPSIELENRKDVEQTKEIVEKISSPIASKVKKIQDHNNYSTPSSGNLNQKNRRISHSNIDQVKDHDFTQNQNFENINFRNSSLENIIDKPIVINKETINSETVTTIKFNNLPDNASIKDATVKNESEFSSTISMDSANINIEVAENKESDAVSLKHDTLLLSKEEATPVPKEVSVIKKDKKFKYDLFASSGLNRNASTHKIAYRFGFMQMLTYRNKLSLCLGSEFEMAKGNLVSGAIPYIRTVGETLTNESFEAIGDQLNKNTNSYRVFVTDKQARLVSKLNSINLPIRINYNVNNRLSLGAGVELNYLLNKSDMKLDSFHYTCLVSVEKPDLRYIRIRNRELRYHAGIQYKVLSRLLLTADCSFYYDNYPFESVFVVFRDLNSNPTTGSTLDDIPYSKKFFNFGIGLAYRITK